MRIGSYAVAVCAAICVPASVANAQTQGRTMTFAEVLARAREQAPQIVSARLAVEETRGRLLGASLRFQTNPELDASLRLLTSELPRVAEEIVEGNPQEACVAAHGRRGAAPEPEPQRSDSRAP